jgi:hypothetical protein
MTLFSFFAKIMPYSDMQRVISRYRIGRCIHTHIPTLFLNCWEPFQHITILFKDKSESGDGSKSRPVSLSSSYALLRTDSGACVCKLKSIKL